MEATQVAELIEKKVVEFFNLMDIEVGVRVEVTESDAIPDVNQEEKVRQYVQVNLEADDAGELIGKHGSRLQDMGYIFNLMLPEDANNYSVVFDVNGYRVERAETVKDIAKRYIEHAALTSTEVDLDPMPAWERRLVHMVASERTDVETVSEGENDNRRVVIKPVSVV